MATALPRKAYNDELEERMDSRLSLWALAASAQRNLELPVPHPKVQGREGLRTRFCHRCGADVVFRCIVHSLRERCHVLGWVYGYRVCNRALICV